MKIAVYAFAMTARFFRTLIQLTETETDVEWSVILPRGHNVRIFDGVIPPERLCYLYADFNTRYRRNGSVDDVPFSRNAESLYMSLYRDKDGYRHLDQDRQLRRAITIYGIYKEFLQRVRPDYILMPDIEVVDGFILLNLCYELGIEPIYYVNGRFLDGVMFARTCSEDLPRYFGVYELGDIKRARALLEFVREKGLRQIAAFRPSLTESGRKLPPPESLLIRAPRSLWRSWTAERLYAGEDTTALSIKTLIRPLLYRYRTAKFDVLQQRYFDVMPDLANLPVQFVLYAMQYTPESSINGIAPYYVDQFRAIDQLLMSLPNGYWLLVKEHPAMVGQRPAAFYKALRKRAGVKLVHPLADSYTLITKSNLVATVTGTIGLECFFLDKPCLMFGPSFFSHLCHAFADWRKSPNFVDDIVAGYKPRTDDEKAVELARLFHVFYDFRLTGLFSTADDLSETTIRAYWSAVKTHIRRLQLADEHAAPLMIDEGAMSPSFR
jgi:hypothetical protein